MLRGTFLSGPADPVSQDAFLPSSNGPIDQDKSLAVKGPNGPSTR